MQGYTFHFGKADDIIEMERVIRTKLKCSPQAPCKFLNSASYVQIKIALIRWLQNLVTHEASMYAYTEDGRHVLRLLTDTPKWTAMFVETGGVPVTTTTTTLRKRKIECVDDE